jgi:hypothetical protein
MQQQRPRAEHLGEVDVGDTLLPRNAACCRLKLLERQRHKRPRLQLSLQLHVAFVRTGP